MTATYVGFYEYIKLSLTTPTVVQHSLTLGCLLNGLLSSVSCDKEMVFICSVQ